MARLVDERPLITLRLPTGTGLPVRQVQFHIRAKTSSKRLSTVSFGVA